LSTKTRRTTIFNSSLKSRHSKSKNDQHGTKMVFANSLKNISDNTNVVKVKIIILVLKSYLFRTDVSKTLLLHYCLWWIGFNIKNDELQKKKHFGVKCWKSLHTIIMCISLACHYVL